MRKLASDQQIYIFYDDGTIEDESQRNKLLANFRAPAELTLKVGAQVMLIRNIDQALVNGSVGKVIGFSDLNTYTYGIDLDASGSKTEKNKPPALGQLFPVVEFSMGKFGTRQVLIQPELWTVELPDGEIQASRSQVYSFL